jgi:hypothetical protein
MLTHNFYQKYISLEKSPRLGKANNDTFWKYLCLRTMKMIKSDHRSRLNNVRLES